MKLSLSLSSNPSRDARRNQVRRLFVRHHLSMGQIARRIGISKPTVMRDLRWWRQQPVEEAAPEVTTADLHREIEDAKEEAWCAYARSVELRELELDAARAAVADDGTASCSDHRSDREKSLRSVANSEWRFLNLISRLIERQAKLVAPSGKTERTEAEDGSRNVVLYLPDNGRDRNKCGTRSAEGGTKQATDSARSCGRKTADENETFSSSECNAVQANPSSNNLASSNLSTPAIPRLTSGATVPDSASSDTELKRNVTICNGVDLSQVPAAANQTAVSSQTPILEAETLNNSGRLKPELQQEAGASPSSIPPSALRNPHSLRPQVGPQEKFLSTPADIAFYGGAAGGGKTWGMLFEALRQTDVHGFRAVVFRRNTVDITNAGGLWDQASEIYPRIGGGIGTRHNLQWRWRKADSAIQFAHLEHESDRHRWQGSQLAMIGFEELTHFTELQFWYLLSRNRSTCGVSPYIRATCNPDPDSWVRRFIEWWIDPQGGLPIPERSGRLRWFARVGDNIEWGDSEEELRNRFGSDCEPKSFTFIAASLYDNPALLQKDPGYLANLKALPRVDREQLLGGNWNVRHTAGSVFRREWFPVIDAVPAGTRRIRYWDRAGTEPSSQSPDPDWTVGLLLARDAQGLFCVQDVVRLRGTPATVEKAILNTASLDGKDVPIGIEQDPAQAGKFEVDYYIRALAGYDVRAYPALRGKAAGDASAKLTRARPASAQAQMGNIRLLRAPWNEPFLACLENFPDGVHDDDVDALSGAMAAITSVPELRVVSSVVVNPRSKEAKERRRFEVEREFWRRAEEGAERLRNAERGVRNAEEGPRSDQL